MYVSIGNRIYVSILLVAFNSLLTTIGYLTKQWWWREQNTMQKHLVSDLNSLFAFFNNCVTSFLHISQHQRDNMCPVTNNSRMPWTSMSLSQYTYIVCVSFLAFVVIICIFFFTPLPAQFTVNVLISVLTNTIVSSYLR